MKHNIAITSCFIIAMVVSELCTYGGTVTKKSRSSNMESQKTYSYELNATGQVKTYDKDCKIITTKSGGNLYGQDANYLKGNQMSFKDNGNGITTDLNTGLVWQKIPASEGSSWADAVEYCNNLKLGGYDDWRMPSCKELYSISDFSAGWPYINTKYFSLATGQVGKFEQYWSSNKYVGTTVEGRDNAAFGVNHVTGHIKAYPAAAPEGLKDGRMPPPPGNGPQGSPKDIKSNSGGQQRPSGPPPNQLANGKRVNPMFKFVRAVRGNEYGVNEFKDNKDETISDVATGLMWTESDNGKGLNWKSALKYAENSEFAGYSDWRLPNVKELQSIVDYSYSPSAIDISKVGPAINPLFYCTPTVNEAGVKDYGYYWTSTSAHFTAGRPFYYAWYVAAGRAVNGEGKDFHGAGAVRFDTKYEGGAKGEGGERYYNYVRLVRNID
jgi:hypothetical protein